MRSDSLKKFVSMRDSLLKEQVILEKRLAQINEALGSSSGDASSASAKSRAPRKAGAGRARNELSLKAAVRKVTSEKPLTKDEILGAIAKLGYTFTTANPVNSLNAVLYSKKQFKNTDGKFSPAK
jgi:hypothetical protein